MKRFALLLAIALLPALLTAPPAIARDDVNGPFEPTWESLDKRPNPAWFEDAKFGIFIHWGVYSVPAWGPKDQYAEWYWHHMQDREGATWKFHAATYGEDFQYQDFAPMFKAELFDPAEWAGLFKRSGAKYIVLTSKHHEGFALWPSRESWNWNAVDIGPHRDLAGDLTNAVRAEGLRMGFYYSIYEWFNPLYKTDINRYIDEHMLPQLKDLVQRYKPDVVWPDGEWDQTSDVWRSPEFLAWLFNESDAPADVVINDRWGKETRNVHGGFATPEYHHIPEGRLIDESRFEECQGMGRSFGYNRNENVDSYRTSGQLIELLVDLVSRGGNLLLDIGPTADGRIPVIMQQRLVDMGQWLAVNGEAIYGTRAWRQQTDGENVYYTAKGDAVYAICTQWPGDRLVLKAPKVSGDLKAAMLGVEGALPAVADAEGLSITIPALTPGSLPCDHAWVIKLTGVQ